MTDFLLFNIYAFGRLFTQKCFTLKRCSLLSCDNEMATVYYHDDYILQGAAPAGYTPAGGAAPMDHSGAGVYPGAMGDTASNLTPIQQQVVFVYYCITIRYQHCKAN